MPPNWGVSGSMEIDDSGISSDDLIVGAGNNIGCISLSNVFTMTASMKAPCKRNWMTNIFDMPFSWFKIGGIMVE